MNAAEDKRRPEAGRILRTRAGATTYLAPREALTEEETLADLRTTIQAGLDAWETRIVIDLAAVATLNSAALELFVDMQERLLRVGGSLKVAHPNSTLREVFEVTGVDRHIPVLDPAAETASPPEPGAKPKRLGDILVEKGLLKPAQVEEAIQLQNHLGRRMGHILIDKGWVTEKQFLQALGEQLSIPLVRLRPGLYDPDTVRELDKEVAVRLKVMPLFKVKGILTLATSDPQAIPTFDEVEEYTKARVRPVLATREEILQAINSAYDGTELSPDLLNDLDDDFQIVEETRHDDYATIDEMAAGSPIINLVNSVIQRAVHDGASDIHIEPSRTRCRIRFRIDGLLYEVMTPKLELHAPLVSRLKVMANLDIAERRLPQDGRIQVHTHGRAVDLRFSSLPGLFGEKVVLRVLDKNQAILDVDKLGMAESNLATFKRLLSRPNGLILVTGPTGSGKTTSLYAALNHLNSIEKNIVTIEDPVEYQVEIINQNEVKAGIGLTFARILKHVLRQDPDIIMVGEIRERETAEIAVQAALTGHLVLSTLHTNDSVGAITRMLEMGVEPYLLSSALIGVVGQRLVRTLCPACKTTYLAPPEMIERYHWQDRGNVRLAKGRGCPECYDSGYKGRMAVHEMLETDSDMQRLIIGNPSRDQLSDYLAQKGMKLLFDDGLDRVLAQQTTLEEVTRAVSL